MISSMSLSPNPLPEKMDESESTIPSDLEDPNGIVRFVTIQWHICAIIGSARDVASGSDKRRVYVVVPLRVRVGAMIEAWMLKIGGEVTFFGLILFPISTVLCFDV